MKDNVIYMHPFDSLGSKVSVTALKPGTYYLKWEILRSIRLETCGETDKIILHLESLRKNYGDRMDSIIVQARFAMLDHRYGRKPTLHLDDYDWERIEKMDAIADERLRGAAYDIWQDLLQARCVKSRGGLDYGQERWYEACIYGLARGLKLLLDSVSIKNPEERESEES